MKTKIFYVIVIAASIAIIIGLALTGNDKASDGQVPESNKSAAVQPVPAPSPIQPPEGASENEIEIKNARMKQEILAMEKVQAAAVDRVDMLRSSVNNPPAFSRLEIKERATVISLELNMNEEQEVLLASYLEAFQAFMGNSETRDFAYSIMNADSRKGYQGIPNVRPEATLDQVADYVEIMALELKEIKGLRDKFLSELTKQQREKFDALPIAATF